MRVSQHAQRRDRNGQNRRLRDFGQTKLIFGPFEAHGGELEFEGFIRFVKRLPGQRIFLGQILAHADSLRALARKEKCNCVFSH